MDTLNRFRIVRLSADLQRQFQLSDLICSDPDGMPFREGNAFYRWMIDENACEPGTAYNYLHAVFPFFTFLWTGSPPLRFSAPAALIRQRVRDYLKEKLGCLVRPHPCGNFIVKRSKPITATSARLFLTALRRFYFWAILKCEYTEVNPMEWTTRLIASEPGFKPEMPARSGLTLPEDPGRRVPDTYFCMVAEEWQPHIIDDPQLRQLLLPAFRHARDRVIARILFDSGARISEVLGLTLADWRCLGQRERARATNKGSHGQRVKEIWWSADTTQVLRDYVNAERHRWDPKQRGLEDLPDAAPLFITDEGAPYTYKAFYAHWRKACAHLQVKITPHQVRHWYVTMALSFIETLPDQTKRAEYRQALVAYIGWRNPVTIQVYDHHLHQLNFAPIHAALARLGEGGSERSTPASPSPSPLPIGLNVISAELAGWLGQAFGWER
jgi:integrase